MCPRRTFFFIVCFSFEKKINLLQNPESMSKDIIAVLSASQKSSESPGSTITRRWHCIAALPPSHTPSMCNLVHNIYGPYVRNHTCSNTMHSYTEGIWALTGLTPTHYYGAHLVCIKIGFHWNSHFFRFQGTSKPLKTSQIIWYRWPPFNFTRKSVVA